MLSLIDFVSFSKFSKFITIYAVNLDTFISFYIFKDVLVMYLKCTEQKHL